MTARAQTIAFNEDKTKTGVVNQRSIQAIGGVCALTVGTLFLAEMIVYIATSAPSLADAGGWFTLFQTNRLLGLVDFGILELYGLVLFVPMFLALYAALRRASESFMAIAMTLAFAGIAANFATSKLFSLLTLSDLWAAATTAAQKAQFLAAGQATLALGALGGIGGSVEGGIPMAVAGLIVSVVMLRSNILGRGVGYVGMLANATGFVMYLRAAAAPALAGSPFFGAFFMLSVLWFILIGLRLLQFGHKHA